MAQNRKDQNPTEQAQVQDEARKPWDRLPGESGGAFEYFRAYLEMGPRRSVIGASQTVSMKRRARKGLGPDDPGPDGQPWKPNSSVPGGARGWYHKHRWKERVEAWDGFVQRQQDEAARVAIREAADENSINWAAQLQDLNRRTYENGLMLEKQAMTIASFPIFQKVVEAPEGRKGVTEIYRPLEPDMLVKAARVAAAGVELQYRAVQAGLLGSSVLPADAQVPGHVLTAEVLAETEKILEDFHNRHQERIQDGPMLSRPDGQDGPGGLLTVRTGSGSVAAG
jgi:hypothetical protein